MPVYLFEGLPGSGKSLHIVKHIVVPALHKGRKIFHNLPLNPEVIETGEDLICETSPLLFEIDAAFIRDLPKHVDDLNGSILVIDEMQDYFVSTEAMWSKDMLGFFAKHRHEGIDIVMATQDKANLNRVVRGFASVIWYFEKLSRFGGKNSYRIDYFKPNKEFPYNKSFGKFDKKYFEYYDSYSQKTIKDGHIEEPIGKKDYRLHSLVAVVVGVFLFSGFMLSGVMNRKSNAEVSTQVESSGSEKNDSAQVENGDLDFKAENVLSDKVVVFNLRGDRVEVDSNAKTTGLVKVGNQYRTIIDNGGKTVIAKSYKPLGFENKFYRPPPKASDFIKDSPSGPSLPQRGREGGHF